MPAVRGRNTFDSSLIVPLWREGRPALDPAKAAVSQNLKPGVAPHEGDTYRAVYTVKFTDAIYVLHAFQKKSQATLG